MAVEHDGMESLSSGFEANFNMGSSSRNSAAVERARASRGVSSGKARNSGSGEKGSLIGNAALESVSHSGGAGAGEGGAQGSSSVENGILSGEIDAPSITRKSSSFGAGALVEAGSGVKAPKAQDLEKVLAVSATPQQDFNLEFTCENKKCKQAMQLSISVFRDALAESKRKSKRGNGSVAVECAYCKKRHQLKAPPGLL